MIINAHKPQTINHNLLKTMGRRNVIDLTRDSSDSDSGNDNSDVAVEQPIWKKQKKHNKHKCPVEQMPTMIIGQDCVTLTIPGPPTPQKQRGYLVRQKIFFNPNKNDQRKLKNVLMKEVAMKDLHAMLPWPKNTAVDISAVFYFSLTNKDTADGLKIGDRCLKHIDLDNLWKFAGDAASQVVYSDDSDITDMTLKKRWGASDLTSIHMRRLDFEKEKMDVF